MKKVITVMLSAIIAISLSACGCSNNATENTLIPNTTIIPNIETNIPDPNVNQEMPIYTEATNSTSDNDLTTPLETIK